MKNQKISNLLVAVDFSAHSKVVVIQAREMASILGAEVSYIYVFENIAVFDAAFEIKKKRFAKYFETKMRNDYLLSKNESVLVKYGRAYEEITRAAKNFKNPMIVLGHRSNQLTRFLLGSTVERVALQSLCPVWIHRSASVRMPVKILIPTDLTKDSSRTIEKVDWFKSAFRSKLEIFHVMQQPSPILDFDAYSDIYREIQKFDDRQMKQFQKEHPSLSTVRSKGGVVDQILKRLKQFDVLVLSPRYHKASFGVFGSVTAKLIRLGEKPILILP